MQQLERKRRREKRKTQSRRGIAATRLTAYMRSLVSRLRWHESKTQSGGRCFCASYSSHFSLERYAAHSCVLLQIVAVSLHIPSSVLPELESTVSYGLLSTAANMSAAESTKKAADNDAVGRRWKVGIATVADAALIGVTGGLAAPFLAAGIGTVMGGLGLSIPSVGGYLGAMAGSNILIGGLFGSYGRKMTGRLMKKYAKEVEDFNFVPLKEGLRRKGEIELEGVLGEAEQSSHKLCVAIGVSGWVVDDSDIIAPWQVFSSSTIEPFALQWEF